eukprot:CAMPEP_0172663256 /NCGR_PEP_ID=MMETSP1074-20121228/5808_1 /TAXON_ID=2916 /ORGANISM="Ceratium fusus, Strain PA161109" /LENGTH=58 /DNA_ID=CAMNT_0013479221 /DNA_START=16 /DNA_END=188 /DNA_ORIENTATION=-
MALVLYMAAAASHDHQQVGRRLQVRLQPLVLLASNAADAKATSKRIATTTFAVAVSGT